MMRLLFYELSSDSRCDVNILKRVQSISMYRRWMLLAVAAATLLRLLLIYFNWPFTESDEGNMGLLALHVAFQGDHPIFFYGGNYLGPLEGYAAAPLFRIFGVSLFALRLPLVLFFTVFLLSMYYLVRLLYQSERFALASVILLGLGSPDVLFLQLRASGEYPELEMFAALMCLLATWLALASPAPGRPAGAPPSTVVFVRAGVVGQRGAGSCGRPGELLRRRGVTKWKRITIYGLLGLIVGLALWVDLLILPFVAGVVLLLALFCRRELLRWPGLALLAGLVAGAFPLIYYNLTAPFAQNSWFVLHQLEQSSAADMLARHLTWLNQLTGTLFVALPMATGGSLHCPLGSIPPAGTPAAGALPCVLFQGGWGTGYLVLWLVAAGLAIFALWRYRMRPRSTRAADLEGRQEAIRQCGRLVILASVGLTLLLYARSPSPATVPDTSFRYLTSLLLALPVLLWPVWRGLSLRRISSRRTRAKIGQIFRVGVLLLVAATFAGGMVRTYLGIPSAQDAYRRDEAVVQDMLRIGATRVYSDYWTCNVLTFLSHEKIICSALDANLNPGYDRYLPYRAIVQAAPLPTYIFPDGTQQAAAIQQRARQSVEHYRSYTFEGYIVYQVT